MLTLLAKRASNESDVYSFGVLGSFYFLNCNGPEAYQYTIFWLEGIGPELYQLVYSALLPSAQRCTDIVYFGIQASVLPSAIVSY